MGGGNRAGVTSHYLDSGQGRIQDFLWNTERARGANLEMVALDLSKERVFMSEAFVQIHVLWTKYYFDPLKTPMILKKFWSTGGGGGGHASTIPLRSVTVLISGNAKNVCFSNTTISPVEYSTDQNQSPQHFSIFLVFLCVDLIIMILSYDGSNSSTLIGLNGTDNYCNRHFEAFKAFRGQIPEKYWYSPVDTTFWFEFFYLFPFWAMTSPETHGFQPMSI